MKIFPTDQEIDIAADLLVTKYKISPQLLGTLFDTKQRDQANSILQSLGRKRLNTYDLAKLLIQREGPELFSGNRKEVRDLRLCI
jgi:hypothetical protein